MATNYGNMFGTSFADINERSAKQRRKTLQRISADAATGHAPVLSSGLAALGGMFGMKLAEKFSDDPEVSAENEAITGQEAATAEIRTLMQDLTPENTLAAAQIAFRQGTPEGDKAGARYLNLAQVMKPKAFAYNAQQDINKKLYSDRIKTTPDDMPSLMDLGLNTTELFGFTQDQSDDASQAQLNGVLTRLGNSAKEQAIAEQFKADPLKQFNKPPESDYYYIREAMALANKTGVLDDLFKDGKLNTGRLPSFNEMKAKEIQIDRRDTARGVYDETAMQFKPQPDGFRTSNLKSGSLDGLMQGTVTPSNLITQQLEDGLIKEEAADYRRGKYAWMQANPEITKAWLNNSNNKQDLLDSQKAKAQQLAQNSTDEDAYFNYWDLLDTEKFLGKLNNVELSAVKTPTEIKAEKLDAERAYNTSMMHRNPENRDPTTGLRR